MSKIKLVLASSLVSLFAFSAALACPGEEKGKTEAKAKGPAPAKLVTANFAVDGMHCAGCVDAVQAALGKTEGVYSVEVKLADKRVVVGFDAAKLTAEKVAKIIADAGFKASLSV